MVTCKYTPMHHNKNMWTQTRAYGLAFVLVILSRSAWVRRFWLLIFNPGSQRTLARLKIRNSTRRGILENCKQKKMEKNRISHQKKRKWKDHKDQMDVRGTSVAFPQGWVPSTGCESWGLQHWWKEGEQKHPLFLQKGHFCFSCKQRKIPSRVIH